ncbi:PilZ domain-containing protein [Paenibacillaceae bacterium WGS1546]|uniref:PilZ domain-containing protein n=1 Tax=Cohnella sp. WGS1546 TaxID=3366810 RepID=UPI00372CFABC
MDKENIENRRAFVRFKPQAPLYVELSLHQVGQTEIGSRVQRVLLQDISLGGCRIATSLALPVREDVEWTVKLQLGFYTAKPRYVIVHSGREDGLYSYGGRWEMTGLERHAFQYRFHEYMKLLMASRPHIRALYKKLAERDMDERFKRLDVTS